ncbi:MAG: hypothetical protein FJ291_18275 [Planctomycetes bacterium]|nr:hypothetical protein [Planctomycetota bacterium]
MLAMTARTRHRLATWAFIGSLAAYLAASGLALLVRVPAAAMAVVRVAGALVALGALASLAAEHVVWAIARNTIAQAIRVKVAFVIMAAYLVLVPSLPFIVKGDGTPRGLLHVVITYSLILAGLLLGVLSLAVSTTTLWTEVRDKQVYLLETKPVRRWQVLLGKLLGIMALNAALLAFMGVVTWLSVHYLLAKAQRAARAIPDSKKKDKELAERRLREAREQVLSARRTVLPDPPPQSYLDIFLERKLDLRRQQLERSDRMPDEAKRVQDPELRKQIIEREARKQLTEEFHNLINAVPPLNWKIPPWHFSGLHVARRHDTKLTVRFKFLSSDRKSEEPDHVFWVFGTPRGELPPKAPNEQVHQVYAVGDAHLPDEVHEIQVPADAIDRDGGLRVQFRNMEPRMPTLVFSESDAMQVLVPIGGFTANLARGLAVIFIEVLFIAILGLFCSTFLSFPVSPIVAISFLLLVLLASSLKAEFEKGFTMDQAGDSPTARAAERVARGMTTALHAILPPLHKYSPSASVSSGEEVPLYGMVLDAVWSIGLVYGGILMLLGSHIFERRELALAST